MRDLAQFAAPIHCPKGPPFGPARSRWEEDPGTAAATRGALGPKDGRRSPLTLVGWGGDGGCVHAAVCQGMGAAPGPRSRGRPPPGSGRGLELGAAGPGQQRRRRRWRGPRRAWGLAPPGAPPAQTRRLRPETHRPGRQRPEGDAAGVGAGGKGLHPPSCRGPARRASELPPCLLRPGPQLGSSLALNLGVFLTFLLFPLSKSEL